MNLVIIDGQGGGFGRALIEVLRKNGVQQDIIAVGINALATGAMLKAGATVGATGENAAIFNASRADIIAGPIGLVMANSMHGECSPAIAVAVAQSTAKKVLIPVAKCGAMIAGLPDKTLTQYLADAAQMIAELL